MDLKQNSISKFTSTNKTLYELYQFLVKGKKKPAIWERKKEFGRLRDK